MTRTVDLTGRRFEMLTVLGRSPSTSRSSRWVVRCDCGQVQTSPTGTICPDRKGRQRKHSCGCKRRSRFFKHGMESSAEHRAWCALKGRCTNPNNRKWSCYGGRGIKVCDRWMNSFEAFYADMGPRPSKHHSVERYDVNGDYCPENCGWELPPVQARNKQRSVRVNYKGSLVLVQDLAERNGLLPSTLRYRIRAGWAERDWLKPPLSQRSRGSGQPGNARHRPDVVCFRRAIRDLLL